MSRRLQDNPYCPKGWKNKAVSDLASHNIEESTSRCHQKISDNIKAHELISELESTVEVMMREHQETVNEFNTLLRPWADQKVEVDDRAKHLETVEDALRTSQECPLCKDPC